MPNTDIPEDSTPQDVGRQKRVRSENVSYDAFVSYSHVQDRVLADALQSELQTFARPWYRSRALRIFRDDTDLAATPGLWSTIQAALEASQWFLLMASPASARSAWVQKEVEWWMQYRATDRILLALTDGEIRWSGDDFDWAVTNAIPRLLSGAFAQEPYWIDLRKLRPAETREPAKATRPRLGDVVAEFAAPIRGLDKDALVGEHVRYRRRARRLVRAVIASLASLLMVAVVAAIVAVTQANNAVDQRDIATSRQLAANAELTGGTDPQLGALLSAAAFVIRDTPEARTSMLHQMSRHAGRQQYAERFLASGDGAVGGVSFSSDGSTLVAGTENGVKLWDWKTGTQHSVSVPPGSWGPVDGNVLASWEGGNIELWDFVNHEQVGRFPAGEGPGVRTIALSSDGGRLAIGGIDFTTIVVWDVTKRAIVATLQMPPSPESPPEGLGVSGLAFSPDGTLLVADASYHGFVIWDVNSGTLASSQIGEACIPFSLTFSPDNRTIAAGCSAHTAIILVWNQYLGAEVARLQAGSDVDGLAFSPDGLTLASGDASGHVLLWDMKRLTKIDTLVGHRGEVNDVAFSPDGLTLASSSEDANIIIWGLSKHDPLDSVSLPDNGMPVAFDPTGKLLLVASRAEKVGEIWATGAPGAGDSSFTVWDVERRVEVAKVFAGGWPLGFTADGRVLAYREGSFAVREIGQGQLVKRLSLPVSVAVPAGGSASGPYGARPVALSRDGRALAAVVGDGTTVVVWDILRDSLEISLPFPHGVSSLAFGFDQKTLAAGQGAGPVVVWDISTASKKAEVDATNFGRSVCTIALSADGRRVASVPPSGGQTQGAVGCVGCDITLWDLDSRAESTLSGHVDLPDSLTFSPDDQMLVSSGQADTILWSIPQHAPMVTLTSTVGPAVFNPNGRTLATATASGTIALWNTDPASWRWALCTFAGRDLTSSEWSAYLPELPYRPVCSA